MCAIVGIYSLTGKPIRDPERRILKMLSMQHHRGPDQSGYRLSSDKRLILGNPKNHPGVRWHAYALASTYQRIQDKTL